MSVQHLEPYIRQILTAPGTDLTTISAKRVRKQLTQFDSTISEEYIRNNKTQIDLLIQSIFGAVSEAAQSGDPLPEAAYTEFERSKQTKRKREDEDDDKEDQDENDERDGYDDPTPSPKPKAPKPRTSRSDLTDEEYARQLSSELNGRASRGATRSSKANGKAKQNRSPKKTKKSAARISDSDDSGGGSDNKKSKKKAKTGAKGGFSKEFILSAPLSSLLEVEKLSRPQVVKRLWEHIKGNSLQNPSNKREIMCDGPLRAIFNVDKIDMFKMNKVLGQHLHEQE